MGAARPPLQRARSSWWLAEAKALEAEGDVAGAQALLAKFAVEAPPSSTVLLDEAPAAT